MEHLGIGIVGAGSLADSHIRAYQADKRARVLAVCDLDANRARGKADQHGIAKSYGSVEELCADPAIEAVSVITWNNTHMPLTVQLLQAGKHVLCEKPPALNAAEALAMQKAAQAGGKVLMVGFVRRFVEKVMLARSFIQNGDIGTPYYLKTGFLRRCGNPGGWFAKKALSGGGPLIDLGVHIIDQAVYLMGGARPVSVFGQVSRHVGPRFDVRGYTPPYQSTDSKAVRESDVEDQASALIRFENGASLFMETSWTQHLKEDAMYTEVFGSKGGLKLEPALEVYGETQHFMTDTVPLLSNPDADFSGAFGRQISHFVDCVLDGAACDSPIEDGVKVMQIIDAIYKSAETNTLVTLNAETGG